VQQPPHLQFTLLYLLLIPLVIWIRLRRTSRAARTSDLWFEPEGDHFIYHPFGWVGTAYLVSAHVRDRIRAKVAEFARVMGIGFVLVAVGPIFLVSLGPDIYLQWRPWILTIRIGLVLALLLAGLFWHLMVIRPFYADAPVAPRRISRRSVHAKQAALRSWSSVGLSFAAMLAGASFFLVLAYLQGGPLNAILGTLLMAGALLNLRTLIVKLRQRRHAVLPASGEISPVDPGIIAPIETPQRGFGRREG
jgi:MFS family permease